MLIGFTSPRRAIVLLCSRVFMRRLIILVGLSFTGVISTETSCESLIVA